MFFIVYLYNVISQIYYLVLFLFLHLICRYLVLLVIRAENHAIEISDKLNGKIVN